MRTVYLRKICSQDAELTKSKDRSYIRLSSTDSYWLCEMVSMLAKSGYDRCSFWAWLFGRWGL